MKFGMMTHIGSPNTINHLWWLQKSKMSEATFNIKIAIFLQVQQFHSLWWNLARLRTLSCWPPGPWNTQIL